jgi:hypothetical protein
MSKLETNTIDNISGSSTLTIGDSNASTISIPKNITLGASGTTITVPSGATIVNSGTQTGFGGANTPAFYVNKNDSQSLSANTTTKIQFDDEVFDTASAYDNSTNYRFTVPSGQAGKYFIHACLRIDSAVDTDDFNIYIYKNGSQIGRKNISHFNYESNDISQLLELSENDYIEIYARVTASVGTEAGATVNFFYGYKIIE